jgi:pimeloyl-ACP methyl ester carboxylesterase
MRRTLLLALLLLTGATLPADAFAQASCPKGLSCRTVTVPLDRSGTVGGTIGLRVGRLRASRPQGAPVVALSGGPGQAALASVNGFAADLGSTVLRQRDLIAFDTRGTGRSGAINCPEMQRAAAPRDTTAAEKCAAKLGDSRRFFTTIDVAEDIEAVREALGVEKISLYGISYGTKVALTYARLHPDRVESLVLDSVVPAEGASALSQEILGAMPRVLGEEGVDQIARLVNTIRTSPAVGPAVDPRGNRHRITAYPASIFDVLLAGDFNPVLRQALPPAIRAVRAGDPAPLMRLILNAQEGERLPPRPAIFSAGLYAATSCEEIAFPWAPTVTSPQERARLALQAAQRAPVQTPFSAADILTLDWIALCLRWPTTPGPRALPAATPDVPALLLNGREDVRTPLEDARRVQAQLPRSRLLSIAGVGHSVIGSDPSGCARRALRAFLRGREVPTRCPRARTGYERARIPVPPLRLRGSEPGRTLRAVGLTLQDAVLALDISPTGEAAGGLRHGIVRFSRGPLLRLRAYEYVPGIRVTTRGRVIRVFGPRAADGRLVLNGKRLTGRLGGQPVNVTLP